MRLHCMLNNTQSDWPISCNLNIFIHTLFTYSIFDPVVIQFPQLEWNEPLYLQYTTLQYIQLMQYQPTF
jgi:hypothetical protein